LDGVGARSGAGRVEDDDGLLRMHRAECYCLGSGPGDSDDINQVKSFVHDGSERTRMAAAPFISSVDLDIRWSSPPVFNRRGISCFMKYFFMAATYLSGGFKLAMKI
jgi:hypothetical protein